jgi:hypothetical protein
MVCIGIVSVFPEAVKPVIPAGPVADQVNVVFAISEVKIISVVSVPEQMVWVKSVFVMDGIGLMSKFSVSVVVPQLEVTLKVT